MNVKKKKNIDFQCDPNMSLLRTNKAQYIITMKWFDIWNCVPGSSLHNFLNYKHKLALSFCFKIEIEMYDFLKNRLRTLDHVSNCKRDEIIKISRETEAENLFPIWQFCLTPVWRDCLCVVDLITTSSLSVSIRDKLFIKSR